MLNNLHFQKPIRFDSLQHSFFPPLMEIMKVAGRRIVPNIRTCKMHKMNIRRVSLILQVWDYGTKAFKTVTRLALKNAIDCCSKFATGQKGLNRHRSKKI